MAKLAFNPCRLTDLVDFPQFFPQLWKTLGRDQTCMPAIGIALCEKRCEK
jgi:hypothetical protein